MAELTGTKTALKSQTIQGNILAIVATVTSVVAVLNTAPVAVAIPAVTAAGAAIWGNLLSIFGRIRATEKIH